MQSNFAELYEKSFQDIKIGEVVKGTVIAVHERDIVVDIAYKAEGILPKDEFSQPELLVVGSEVEVLFEGFNDVEGTAILSKRKADRQKTWNDILSNATEGAIVDGRISRKVRGGFMVDIGMEAFLPASLVDIKPVRNQDMFLGLQSKFLVVKINHKRKNVVVSRKDHHFRSVPFFEDIRGFGDLVGPRNIGHMQQPFDARLEFDERAVIGEVPDGPGHATADLELVRSGGPGILLRLFRTQRDLLRGRIKAQNHNIQFHSDRKDLTRVIDALGPGKLTNVDQPLNSGLEFHESAVRQNIDDLAVDLITDRVTLIDRAPGIRPLLLETKGDLLFDLIDRDDNNFDVITDLHEVRGMRNASPAHIRDMEKTIEVSDVDEDAEIRDVLHFTLHDLTHLEGAQFFRAGFVAAFFKKVLA